MNSAPRFMRPFTMLPTIPDCLSFWASEHLYSNLCSQIRIHRHLLLANWRSRILYNQFGCLTLHSNQCHSTKTISHKITFLVDNSWIISQQAFPITFYSTYSFQRIHFDQFLSISNKNAVAALLQLQRIIDLLFLIFTLTFCNNFLLCGQTHPIGTIRTSENIYSCQIQWESTLNQTRVKWSQSKFRRCQNGLTTRKWFSPLAVIFCVI